MSLVDVQVELQVHVGTIARDDRVGTVSRDAGVAAVEQYEYSNE